MNKLIFILAILNVSFAYAQVDQKKLIGTWVSGCIASQIYGEFGYVIESYQFEANGYNFKREWYKEPDCKKFSHNDSASGSFQIGKENNKNSMNPSGTHDIEFITKGESKMGLIWMTMNYTQIRVSRDFNQNTLLSIFLYSKKN